MTRIEREDYVMTGIVVDSKSIRRSLRGFNREGFRVNTNPKDEGRIVYFETRVDGHFVEVMKQRSGYMGLINVRGNRDSYRNDVLNKILMDMSAVEINPEFVYGEFDRMSGSRK